MVLCPLVCLSAASSSGPAKCIRKMPIEEKGRRCMQRDTAGRDHRLCAVGCISLPARDRSVVLHLLCFCPSDSFLFSFKILRLTTLIDCPAGSVADPSHYPASRCVLPVTAQAAEAAGGTGGRQSQMGY